MKPQETTIDELMAFLSEHMFTKEDGTELTKRMDQLDSRMDGLDSRMDTLETRVDQGFSAVNTRLDSIDRELQDVNKRLTILEEKVQAEGSMFARDVLELRQRVDVLEAQVRKLQAA
jgi:chromosome segregation ATPase